MSDESVELIVLSHYSEIMELLSKASSLYFKINEEIDRLSKIKAINEQAVALMESIFNKGE